MKQIIFSSFLCPLEGVGCSNECVSFVDINMKSYCAKIEVDQDLLKTLEAALQGLEGVELSYRAELVSQV